MQTDGRTSYLFCYTYSLVSFPSYSLMHIFSIKLTFFFLFWPLGHMQYNMGNFTQPQIHTQFDSVFNHMWTSKSSKTSVFCFTANNTHWINPFCQQQPILLKIGIRSFYKPSSVYIFLHDTNMWAYQYLATLQFSKIALQLLMSFCLLKITKSLITIVQLTIIRCCTTGLKFDQLL